MRTRPLLIPTVAILLSLPACKKEFLPGETVEVVDTVSATNATTYGFSYGWGGSLVIRPEGSPWSFSDTLGGVRITDTLQTGDRLIATMQVGLSQTNANLPCIDSLFVSLGAVLGGSFTVTPNSAGVVPFAGAFSVDSLWQQNVWVKQFMRQQEFTVTSDMVMPVVQTFARLRSLNDGCTADTVQILNRSLTLTVLHP